MRQSVLVVGTCPEPIDAIVTQLGVKVERANDFEAVLRQASEYQSRLIIYSNVHASIELFDFCIALRNVHRVVPLVVAMRHSTIQDRVMALETGADDFLDLELPRIELRARLAALLRRVEIGRNWQCSKAERRIYEIDTLEIDLDHKEARLDGIPLALSPTEYSILETLALQPGKTVSRSTLSDSLWGYDSDVYDDNIKWHICRLRKKLTADATAPEYIATVRNRGYRLLSSTERKFQAKAA